MLRQLVKSPALCRPDFPAWTFQFAQAVALSASATARKRRLAAAAGCGWADFRCGAKHALSRLMFYTSKNKRGQAAWGHGLRASWAKKECTP